MHISVLLETPELLAVSKPTMLNTIPGGNSGETCLLHYLQEKRNEKLWVIDRLDKEVSGIVLFARNEEINKYLSGIFNKRDFEITYITLVIGNVREKEASINEPIREFGSGRMGVAAGGKEAETSYQLIAKGNGHSLMRLKPSTGRRHQLRVHMYHIGHPIAGDHKYGDKALQSPYPRLMLHAFTLEFRMPDNEIISIRCNPSEDFKEVLTNYGIKGVSKLK